MLNYILSYFKFKIPISIRDEPANKSLKHLKTELQANISSVETDLAGRNYSYLALVLTDEEYALISNTHSFILP